MICDRFYELMSAKLDGELTEEEAEALQAHLEICGDCRRVYEAMASIETDLAGLEQPAPAGLKQGVLYRIGQETGSVKKSKRRFWGVGTGMGLAAAVLVLLVGVGVIRMPKPSLRDKQAASAAPAQDADPYEIDPDSLEDLAQAHRGDSGNMNEGFFTLPNGESSFYYEGTAEDLPTWPEWEEPAPEMTEDMRHPTPAEAMDDATEPCDSEPALGPDFYYSEGNKGETDGERLSERPVTETLTERCTNLCAVSGAPVLLYTEFPDSTVFSLLEEAEPELLACFEEAEPQTEDEVLGSKALPASEEDEILVIYTVDCQTALALQEWLLENLPRSMDMPDSVSEAEGSLIMRMQELDPGSGSLYGIITWAPRQQAIAWPASWPKGWAVRFRTGENWSLFFPEETDTPEPDEMAFLVFLEPEP